MSAILCMASMLASGLAGGQASVKPATQIEFSETLLQFASDSTKLALRDLDGDGDRDLILVESTGLTVYLLGPNGRFDLGSEANPGPTLPWPEKRIGWDFADLDGDQAVEVVFLLEDGRVRAYSLTDEGFDAGRDIIQDKTYLPPGVSRVRFVRDVDGDGRQDLIFPGLGSHRIFFAREGGWSNPIEIEYDQKSSLSVGDRARLSSNFGQEIRIPWFRLEDIDGDGHDDLVAETEDSIAFHLAEPDLSDQASWSLSLSELRSELPERGDLDFDNLLSLLEQNVSWRIADLDGVPPLDLIVVIGAKFRVYLGGSKTGPDDSPDQVLKSSGNVLYSFVRQAEGDELLDLQIVRAERISVGRVLRSIILPSAFDFDLFTYRNEGGAFSRRPTRRNKVTFEVPRLLSFMDEADELGKEAARASLIRTTRVPHLPGTPAMGDDVVDVRGDELVFYSDCAPEPLFLEEISSDGLHPERLIESYFLRDLDARGDGAERTLDLGDLVDLDLSTGAVLQSACEGQTPIARVPLALAAAALVKDVISTDINGDGQSDVIVVGSQDEQDVVQFLIRR